MEDFKKSYSSKSKKTLNILITSSFTSEPIEPYLGGMLIANNINCIDIKFSDYSQVIQTCLNVESLNEKVDILIIMWRLDDLSDITKKINDLDSSVNLLFSSLKHAIEKFKGEIIFNIPPRPEKQITDLLNITKQSETSKLWHKYCLEINKITSSSKKAYLVDFGEIQENLDNQGHDLRKNILYKQPYTEDFYVQLAFSISRLIKARTAPAKKCIVLDCDNTIWNGIVGEDGLNGINLSNDYPGLPFKIFQYQLSEIRKSGIFIAICSKNNPKDVWEVFEKHNEMVLTKDDISSAMINWSSKSENIRQIAKELNIGLDSIVFIDDNPFELSEVSTHIPEVFTIQIPEDISYLPKLLEKNINLFDRLEITEDDFERVNRTKLEIKRKSLMQNLSTEDFLKELNLEVLIKKSLESDLNRITQLINKTNQFNCLTMRYTQSEVYEYHKSTNKHIITMTVNDKFGEYGLVGLAMVRIIKNTAFIDNFLLSCRVLGRGVETSLMSALINFLKKNSVNNLYGYYIPTNKNKIVSDFYAKHGFSLEEDSDEKTSWLMNLKEDIKNPNYINLINEL